MHEPARDMYAIGKPLDLDPSLQTLDPDPLLPGFFPVFESTSRTYTYNLHTMPVPVPEIESLNFG